MRILVLGNNYSSKKLFEYFEKNKDNIVFSTILNGENYIDFENSIENIVDFCEVNEINLVVIIDEDYINSGLQEILLSKNITAFSPSSEAIGIVASKALAKRFMYRNKILTPQFMVADKPQTAFDYVNEVGFPLAIKPDNHSFQECALFCETNNQARKIINNFFSNGNKKIIIEDYIEGKNISVCALSDGYNAKIILTSAKYQNDISYFEPEFLSDEIKQRIYNEIIMPTISSLSAQENEYIGVLEFDIILDKNDDIYLIGYNNFFGELNIDFILNAYELDWANIFDSCLVGDVFLKYDFVAKYDYMFSIRQNEEIKSISAKTMSNVKLYLKELGYDMKLFDEAMKKWKY